MQNQKEFLSRSAHSNQPASLTQQTSLTKYLLRCALAIMLVLSMMPLAAGMAFAADVEQSGIDATDAGVDAPGGGETGSGDLSNPPASTEPDPSGIDLLPLTPLVSLEPLADYTIDLSGSVSIGTGYTWNMASKIITFTTAANGNNYRIIQSGGTQNVLGIVVANGVDTTITIQNINLQTVNSPFRLEGSAKLALQLVGSNTLKATSSSDGANDPNAGLGVPSAASLSISGTGSLKVTSGYYAAGIGSNRNTVAGSIVINSGTVSATGVRGAGIGGSIGGSGGTITISGGTVTASGGGGGAGIGGSDGGSGGFITINNGTVTANGDGGTGIGGGYGGSGGAITISGGTVTANGVGNSAGIGGGYGGSGGTIAISNGNVTANGSSSSAGIGGSAGGSSGTITISGGTVAAEGGIFGAGIGGTSCTITISGGTVVANGGRDDGAGIGGHEGSSGGTITISGGIVTANSGGLSGSAGIGGGSNGSGGTISIKNNATVIAKGGFSRFSYSAYSGAGIGGGDGKINDPTTSVSIDSTANVKAYAGLSTTPAIDAYYGNSGNGYYVSAYLNTATSTERRLVVHPNGAVFSTGSLYLPANYQSFAYTTGNTVEQNDNIYAYNPAGTNYLGRIERVYDSSPSIFSTLNAAPIAVKLNSNLAFEPPSPVVRHVGSGREHTAVLASNKAYPSTVNAVIIANSGNFPDALAAAPLAGVVNGPILLTPTKSLHSQVKAELVRLAPKTVYIIGDANSVSTATRNQIKSALPGVQIVALGGKSRFETSKLIADKVVELGGSSQQAFLVKGSDYPDALAASSVAAFKKIPILLTDVNTLSAPTKDFIIAKGVKDITILGNGNSVSQGIQDSLGSLGVTTVLRATGDNRYATALDFVNKAVGKWSLSPTIIGVASGNNFPDALAGGASIGNRGGLLLITNPTTLSDSTKNPISTFKSQITSVEILGGTPSVSAGVEAQVKSLLL